MIYHCIQKKLFQNQEKKYKEFMLKSIPNEQYLIGVRMSFLKKEADKLIKNGCWQEYIAYTPYYHEERIIQALVIAKNVYSFDDVALIKGFVGKITNWVVCDCFCTYLKAIQNHLSSFFDLVNGYISSTKEFEVRFGLVLLLTYYVNKKYLPSIFKILDTFSHSEYYAQMAAAWLLSLCYVKFKSETKEYLLHSKLDDETFNKGIQKIIESNLVSKEEYPFLKALKRH